MNKLKLNGYYLHCSGNLIFKLRMITSYHNGVKVVGGNEVNRKGESDWWEGKRDDFLEEFCSLTPKAAEKLLKSWAIAKEVLE